MNDSTAFSRAFSRRKFLQTGALGAAALASGAVLWPRDAAAASNALRKGAATQKLPLNRGWLFGGRFVKGALDADFNDASFQPVTLPHNVTKLSWRAWDYKTWQDVWAYRRHFQLPQSFAGKRVFLHFDGVMVIASPTINGYELPDHLGGYLPARYEITDWVQPGDNVVAVKVDSRWSQVPPDGKAKGPISVDYLEVGGIYRPAHLEAVPQIFISDVFARPVNVLSPSRCVEVACTIDAAAASAVPMRLRLELKDGSSVKSRSETTITVDKSGETQMALTLTDLGDIGLWDVDTPRLYNVVATLLAAGKPVHEYNVRIGFRDARFEVDGFFLNGRRFKFFGLNRHEIYPYLGGAMPERVLRRDADILRRDFNCNIVRCSHYPQSEAFLDRCDELGLMAWEEPPGWGFLGDDAWKDIVVQNVKDMIVRDRNHPSIVIWGVRVNESGNDPDLYKRTTRVARNLDGSRACSGSMTAHSLTDKKGEWAEDVFAMDDYHSEKDGGVGIDRPLPDVPYMISEMVGQFNYSAKKEFTAIYRRAGDVAMQEQQALRHAKAHSVAAGYERMCGAIAWCAFEYPSLLKPFEHENIKHPGVADLFRIPKLGASFYLAQTDPHAAPVIVPNFYWDFGPKTPRGPGKMAAIFSNCERLEILIDGKHHADLTPDNEGFPHIRHAPFFVDLDLDGAHRPGLMIRGFRGEKIVLTRRFSSDPARDQLLFAADDKHLMGDGSDGTRIVFGVVDKYGAPRAFGGGTVRFELSGPGVLYGDNPFQLADAGGLAAVWIKTQPGGSGHIRVAAMHSSLGRKDIRIKVSAARDEMA